MDRLIRDTLKEQAEQVKVAPDAWAVQRARLDQRPARSPLRWLTVAGEALVACAVIGLLLVPSLRLGPRGSAPPVPPKEIIKPRLEAPSPQVVVNPDRPKVTPPDWFLPQATAQVKAIDLLKGQTNNLGQFELTRAAIEGDEWRFTFTALLPVPNASHGRGGPRFPAQPVTAQKSDLTFIKSITIGLDGRTGDLSSTNTQGWPLLPPEPAKLQEYEGRIVSGGEQTQLRRFDAEGRPELGELAVWVPEQALMAGDLKYWQLLYGSGKQVKVWGQTIGDRAIIAYKIEILDPPAVALTAAELWDGIPVMPGGQVKSIASNLRYGYLATDREAAIDWYLTQMDRYGWRLVNAVPRSAESRVWLVFQNETRREAQVDIYELPGEVQLAFRASAIPEVFPDSFDSKPLLTPTMDAARALALLVESLQGIAAFAEFPRTPTWRDVDVNVGGPPPGVTIPVRFESAVSPGAQAGSFDILLVKRWQEKDGRWRYNIDPDGRVTLLSHEGEDLPVYR